MTQVHHNEWVRDVVDSSDHDSISQCHNRTASMHRRNCQDFIYTVEDYPSLCRSQMILFTLLNKCWATIRQQLFILGTARTNRAAQHPVSISRGAPPRTLHMGARTTKQIVSSLRGELISYQEQKTYQSYIQFPWSALSHLDQPWATSGTPQPHTLFKQGEVSQP